VAELDARVFAAHADAWEAEGRLRAHVGGGVLEIAGARLSASGLPAPQWNNGDVIDPARIDLARVREWYATRAHGAGVPWGMRVPTGMPFPHGRFLFRKRCMGLMRDRLTSIPVPPDVTFEIATARDLDIIASIDAEAFDTSFAQNRPWIAPHLDAEGFTVGLARLAGEPVGVATAITTAGRAGRCVGIFGVAVLAAARGRGIASALTAWLLRPAFDAGATLAHLSPDTDVAARIYARLGFVETAGLDVYVDL